jgi:hypothetical protein
MTATKDTASPEASAKEMLRHSLVLLDAIVRNERSQVCRESERKWRWNVSDAAKLIAVMQGDSTDARRDVARLLTVAHIMAEKEPGAQLCDAVGYFARLRAWHDEGALVVNSQSEA